MRQRIGKELKRLRQCLLYVTAVRVRTAAWRKPGPGGGVAIDVPIWSVERRLAGGLEQKAACALGVIGKALGSLPISHEGSDTVSAIEAFVSKLREEDIEFCSRDRADKPAVPHFSGRTKVSRSPGLESLLVTLNLARGDLEGSVLAS